MEIGFGTESLPQTVKDAVETTRNLGIRYLWVDALCIIQDSPEDKLKEIAGMGAIYKNATVTIAVSTVVVIKKTLIAPQRRPRLCGSWVFPSGPLCSRMNICFRVAKVSDWLPVRQQYSFQSLANVG